MKKIKNAKLSLKTETIRQLSAGDLRQAYGGGDNTVNPCNQGATRTICLTYVQNTCIGCGTRGNTCATCFCTTNTQYPC